MSGKKESVCTMNVQRDERATKRDATVTPGDDHINRRQGQGIGASPGVAVGPVLLYRQAGGALPSIQPIQRPAHTDPAANRHTPNTGFDPADERARLRKALAAAVNDLRALEAQVRTEIGAQEAGIFASQALMLEDPTIEERANELIEAGADASVALTQATEEQAELLLTLPDPLWQARAADVRDAAERAFRWLATGATQSQSLAERIAAMGAPVIVVADDLTPSDTAHMRPDTVLGIALAQGSTTAHAAILARALGIPAVMGLGDAFISRLADGDTLIIDGATGEVIAHPFAEQVVAATAEMQTRQAQRTQQGRQTRAWRWAPGRMRDGVAVRVMANIGGVADARAAAEAGAEGIGLLRTEFLFSGLATLPTENEQTEMYCDILDAFRAPEPFAGRVRHPVIIRTLDAGADKPLPALASLFAQTEANPALGVRGIRLSLAAPDVLATQLRAIVRAVARTGVQARIMAPMIATLEELRAIRQALRTARDDLARQGIRLAQAIPLGIMIETPAAVFACDDLAREAAFFSIGANDLTQYVMAADRLNAQLAALCDPLQPAVLRAIAMITSAGQRVGRPVGVCGEMAGDPQLALLLAGLGVHEVSMTPQRIPAVKEALARYTLAEAQATAQRILAAPTFTEALALLNMAFPNNT